MVADDPTITLRPITLSDLDFAWNLYRQSMKPLTEALMEWVDERQKQVVERDVVSGEASIIVQDGHDRGWLRVRESIDGLELCQLYVTLEVQNRGIGTVIVERLIGEARRKGKKLNLEVVKNNRARRLYERLGFVPAGESEYKLRMTWTGDNRR